MKSSDAVNLEDVAQRTGVSPSTVSRAINRPEKVKTETRERIHKAIRALGYRPSRVARRLRSPSGHAYILGLIIPDIQNPFYAEVARGVEDVAYDEGYAVILCSSDENAEREQFYLEVLRSESADGVIVAPHDSSVSFGADAALPVVCFDRRPPTSSVDAVVANNRQGAYDLTAHLVRQGHRRVGIACGPLSLSTSTQRLAGYRSALTDAGLAHDEELVYSGAPKPGTGRRAAEALMSLSDPPTALFAANNQLALGVLEFASKRGLRIPDDVAVVGFDDAPWASLLAAPLTTIRQPSYEMGRRAAEMLFQRIADPAREAALITLQTSLVIRQSCGAVGSPVRRSEVS